MRCQGGSDSDCTNCYYPQYLNNGRCTTITCLPTQIVDSLLGCVDCSTKYPHAATCNNITALSCLVPYVYLNNVCISCGSEGFAINDKGDCEEVCGDGMNFFGVCDDGNTLPGDGCSSNCTVEPGWECVNFDPRSPSFCKVTGNLTVALISGIKILGKNEIIIRISLSMPIRLTKANTTITLTNDALVNCTMTTISLTEYQFDIFYKATIQDTKLVITLNIARGRLL